MIQRYPPYPLFEGERYVGLAYKYMLIDETYELLVLDKPLVNVEYQQDGSSVNMYSQYWRNPKGFSFFRRIEMVCTRSKKRKIISCIHYVATSIIAQNKHFIKESPYPILTIAAIVPGILWYLQIKRKVKSNSKLKVR